MTQREFFHRTFDSLPVPENLTVRAIEDKRRNPPAPRRALRTAIVAAALIAALSVCAAAAGFLGGKKEFVDLCNGELDELRALGLFHIQFELTEDDHVGTHGPGGTPHGGEYTGEVLISGGGATVYCHLEMDTDTKKISGMSIEARPQKDWGGTFNPNPAGLYTYDNYDAIIDTDMTIGEYCEIWRQYQGYERYELPEGVSPETRLLDADTLDAWSFTLEGNGICIPFFRENQSEPGFAWISYAETGSGPVITFGNASLKG